MSGPILREEIIGDCRLILGDCRQLALSHWTTSFFGARQ